MKILQTYMMETLQLIQGEDFITNKLCNIKCGLFSVMCCCQVNITLKNKHLLYLKIQYIQVKKKSYKNLNIYISYTIQDKQACKVL